MQIDRQSLEQAVSAELLTAAQAEALWKFLQTSNQHTPRFTFTHVLYYLGGAIAIGAMSLFMTLAWGAFGDAGGFVIAVGYAAIATIVGNVVLRHDQRIPAGILYTFAVALAPLAIYALQRALGYWEGDLEYRAYHTHIDWRWMLMELGTLAVAAMYLFRYRMPFLVMPVAVTLWYMSMDIVQFLTIDGDSDWELRKQVSVLFGVVMILLAFWIDLRTRRRPDFGFWLYLFGALAFWCGLSTMDSGSEWGRALYCAINVGMLLLGAVLGRRVFAVLGGFGIAGYLGHLSYTVFEDSMLFPFALSLIGFAIVGLGFVWQRFEARVSAALRGGLPVPLRELLEASD
jgi:MFS family permease